MPRTVSAEFNRRAHSVENDDYPVILVEINHADLLAPVRLCRDNQNITSNGDVYTAIAMEIQLPDDAESSSNVSAVLSIDNTGKELVAFLEGAAGGRGATVTLSVILRSDPDTVEISYQLDLANISITPMRMEAEMIYPDVLNQSAVSIRYRPSNTPPLF